MLILTIAAAMSAAAADPTAATAMDSKAETEERIVCRDVKVTGTRFGKRYCKPVSAWRAIVEKSEQAVREIQDRQAINMSRECTQQLPCGF